MRKLSEVTKHLTTPEGIKSSGWPQVERRCRDLGIRFDDWQVGAGRLILAKTADERYAATVGGVGMSLPRQVGKTYLVGAMMFAFCIDAPGLTVIWTAHHSRTAGETFLAMQAFASREKIEPYIAPNGIRRGSGKEEVRFANRSRIMFGARERGFGRGFSGVDVLVCDEAQILTDKALDNMLATMNTAPNPLPLFMGTPPTPTDPSEAFQRMRGDALSGESTDLAWIECGADDKADPDDRNQWAKANPSYPHRTPESSLLRLRKKLTGESWMREGLGIWDEEFGGGVFGTAAWAACRVSGPSEPPDGRWVLGVAVSIDLAWTSIGAAVPWGDDELLLRAQHRDASDPSWVVDEVWRIQQQRGCDVVIDGKGPGSSLLTEFENAGVDVIEIGTGDVCDASADLYDRVRNGTVAHMGEKDLDDAHAASVWRPVGERWAIGRRQSHDDVSMLEACTLAAWGVDRVPVPAIY